jgi:protein SCO1/2
MNASTWIRAALVACLLATLPALAKQPALPRDSVYQLDVELVDQAGKQGPWRTQRGKPRLVAMFYTSCQYICPLIVDSGKAIERQLTPAEQKRIGITLISMDPRRDTPKALAAVVAKRKLDTRRWTLASPRQDDVRQIAGVLGVRYRQLADGEFNHTSALVLLDAEGRVLARTEKMGSQADPEFVASVRKALAAAPATR